MTISNFAQSLATLVRKLYASWSKFGVHVYSVCMNIAGVAVCRFSFASVKLGPVREELVYEALLAVRFPAVPRTFGRFCYLLGESTDIQHGTEI